MPSEFNASNSFSLFNNTFKNINQKKNEYNEEMSNNFYVNDNNEFVELGDFSVSDSQNNVYGNEEVNIFSFNEDSYDTSNFEFDEEGGSFFDDLG